MSAPGDAAQTATRAKARSYSIRSAASGAWPFFPVSMRRPSSLLGFRDRPWSRRRAHLSCPAYRRRVGLRDARPAPAEAYSPEE